MRKSRKFALVGFACLITLVFAIAGTVGVLKVSANGDLSDNVNVNLIEPPVGVSVSVFTADGQLPKSIPIAAVALVTPISPWTVDGVDFVLNPAILDGTQTEADDVAAGTDVTELGPGSTSEWEAVVDLASAGNFTDNLSGDLMSVSTIAALARISSAARVYTSAYDEFDEVAVTTIVKDGSAVDTNANIKPDAAGLAFNPSGTFIGTNSSGRPVISFWRPLDSTRITTELSQVLDTADGPVFIDVTAPTLAEIQAWTSIYNMYDEGRLLVTLAGLPTDLLDGPAGVDPLAEFAGGLNSALPAPQNIFALVNILMRDTAVIPAQWQALKQIPAGAPYISFSMEGPGVAAQLAALGVGADVRAYTYNTTMVQDGVNILDLGNQKDWAEVMTFALSRDTVAAGDDTIAATFALASVIVASNGAPIATTLLGTAVGGGGGGGSCFIATAAYGTPLADDINVLRAVRDSYLLNNAVGAAFVDTYYRLSPSVADAVANNALLKAAVRTLLAPVVIVGNFILAMPGASLFLLFACVGLAVSRIRRRMTQV